MTAGGPKPPIYARDREIGGEVRSARNESPYAPSVPILAAARSSLSQANRYPDPNYRDLREALANELRVPAECIMLGAGSASVLQRLVRVICGDQGAEVLFTGPTYDGYKLFAEQAGARAVQIPATPDGAVDLNALADAIGPDTRMVIVCNPHNPTGLITSSGDLRRFLGRVDERVVVVLDEAYREFSKEPATPDGVEVALARWAHGRYNVVAVRTFSKAYGLAGLRLGYGIAPPQISAAVSAAAVPAEITAATQAAGVTALRNPAGPRDTVARVVAERTRVLAALHDLGFDPPPSQANFIYLGLDEDSRRFAAHCWESERVLVQAFPEAGVRVSIGAQADNDRLLRAAYGWVSGAFTA